MSLETDLHLRLYDALTIPEDLMGDIGVVDILTVDVFEECDRQVTKWGIQSHPNGTGQRYYFDSVEARNICEERFMLGVGTWTDILKEEFYEALAEEDPVKLRAELVQVAAVCASWIRDIDARAAAA